MHGSLRTTGLAFLLLAVFLIAPSIADTRQLASLNPEIVDQAIQLAADDKTANRFLDRYVLQTRAGWGNGPLIGTFSTPFARVVQAALAARRRGEVFTAANVAPELLAPELHVIATTQQALSIDDTSIATVQSVALARRGSTDPSDLVHPSKTIGLTTEYQKDHGTTFAVSGVVAIFPLATLATNPEIHVVFDRIARASPGAMCRECVVPVNVTLIK